MSLITWVLLAIIILVAIGLGVGEFFGSLFRGTERVAENDVVQNATQEAQDFIDNRTDANPNHSP